MSPKNLRRSDPKVQSESDRLPNVVGRLLRWFAANARDLPWRRTRDSYAIWVSEIMLQQTQVKTVIPYWERWMRALPNVRALARADSGALHKLWEGLGYYTRVRNMHSAARQILALHRGRFPRDFDAILALPGVGRYTAGAIASIAFSQPRPILDGNVIRVLTRLFGIAGDPRDKQVNARLWDIAESLVRCAAPECSAFNQSLMELGALVCTPNAPACPACPLNRICVARRTGRTDSIPRRVARPTVTRRRFIAFVAERNGCYLVRKRPARVVNAHLWEFPNIEVPAAANDRQTRSLARKLLGAAPAALSKLQTIRHSITRYRITMDVYGVTLRSGPAPKARDGRWLPLPLLRRFAFTGAHRRIADSLAPSTHPRANSNSFATV